MESSDDKKKGFFVPLSEESVRAIKVAAATEGRQLQDLTAECLLSGFDARTVRQVGQTGRRSVQAPARKRRTG